MRGVTPQKGERVLDLGTGMGNVLKLIPQETSAFPVDRSFEMIKRAKKNINSNFVVGDALSLPFRSSVFDLGLAVGIFEYIRDREGFFREISRVIRPHGLAIITSSPNTILTAMRNLLGHRVYSISPEEFNKKAHQAGFITIGQSKTILQNQYLLLKLGNHEKGFRVKREKLQGGR